MPLSRKICCGGDWRGWAEVRGRQGQELFLGFVLSLMGNRHQNTSWSCSFTSNQITLGITASFTPSLSLEYEWRPFEEATSIFSILFSSSELKWVTRGWGERGGGSMHVSVSFWPFFPCTVSWTSARHVTQEKRILHDNDFYFMLGCNKRVTHSVLI